MDPAITRDRLTIWPSTHIWKSDLPKYFFGAQHTQDRYQTVLPAVLVGLAQL
jgi:hypothetical protein